MVDARPFAGVRYNTARHGADISALVCPPYDVISAGERQSLEARSPWNMVRLELPSGPQPYESAAAHFNRWMADGVLRADEEAALYPYLTRFVLDGEPRERRGVLGMVKLEPWQASVVRPHERTLAAPKRDRLELMRACRANFSPIWLLYGDTSGATEWLWDCVAHRDPAATAVDADGVQHHLWAVADRERIRAFRQALLATPAYIADGHHRYETALAYRDEAWSAAARRTTEAAAGFAMVYMVERSDPGLVVLGTHRVLRLPTALDPGDVRRALLEYFDLEDRSEAPLSEMLCALEGEARRPCFGVWSPVLGLRAVARLRQSTVPPERTPERSDAWRRLDLAALHALAIDRLFPQGTSALGEAGYLNYTRSIADVEEAVAGGGADLAFLVRPTPIDHVLAVADAGDLMPEKSTYFYPKPASGLVIARLENDITAVS